MNRVDIKTFRNRGRALAGPTRRRRGAPAISATGVDATAPRRRRDRAAASTRPRRGVDAIPGRYVRRSDEGSTRLTQVGYRRAVAMEIRRFDFSSGAARCFIREPFGPREAHAMFAIENDMMVPLPDGPPWIPRQTWDARTRDVGVVPRVTVRGIERAALSPWVDTEPILGWDRATPPSPSRYAPPRPADAPSPSLEGVAIFEFRRDPPPTSKQFERHHNRSRREYIGKSCAVCGVGATTDGGKLLRCARCNFVSYCSRRRSGAQITRGGPGSDPIDVMSTQEMPEEALVRAQEPLRFHQGSGEERDGQAEEHGGVRSSTLANHRCPTELQRYPPRAVSSGTTRGES